MCGRSEKSVLVRSRQSGADRRQLVVDLRRQPAVPGLDARSRLPGGRRRTAERRSGLGARRLRHVRNVVGQRVGHERCTGTNDHSDAHLPFD